MFHPDSHTLQKFMNPIVKKYQQYRERQPFLSKTSEIFIEKIMGWMEDADKSFHKTTIKETEMDKLVKGAKYYHIPEYVKDHIERMKWTGKKLSFSIGTRIFHIHLVHPLDTWDETKIHQWFDEIKQRIYCWLHIASMQSTKGCSKTLNIYIFFTDLKKKFTETDILGEMNVNTAYTFACGLSDSGENEMYLYRKEEWFKVFIHESFHAFGLDFANMSRDIHFKIDRQVLQIFPLNIDLRLYETYTELWAEIINIIYIIHSSKIKNKMAKIVEFFKMEQLYSLFQAIKILKHNRISYSELYEMTESAKMKRIHHYKESTPIMAYYILKSICIMSIGVFIEWTALKNKGSLNFRKTESTLTSFIEFIDDRYNRIDYLKAVEFTEGYYSIMHKKKLIGGSSPIIDFLTNLRMSMFEIV